MIIELVVNNEKRKADLTRPIDLSLTSKIKNSFKAWYVDEIQINVIKNGDFVGSVKQGGSVNFKELLINPCLLYTSPSPRDRTRSRMPSSA